MKGMTLPERTRNIVGQMALLLRRKEDVEQSIQSHLQETRNRALEDAAVLAQEIEGCAWNVARSIRDLKSPEPTACLYEPEGPKSVVG